MNAINTYEVVRFADDGLVLITMDHDARLTHANQSAIEARIEGNTIVAGNAFTLCAVPKHLLGYFRSMGALVFAELFAGKVIRTAKLELSNG